ncbi:MAG: FeoB-associated Cys-rich membrane protein [Candidatus Methanomethylophilus sp.]|nr:FeoB-associated Cys-rich membrane protein [Methanomethylophilus sp.]
MNLATVAVLILIFVIVGGAAYRVYRMIRDGNVCYGCSAKCSECRDGNPINCTFDKK